MTIGQSKSRLATGDKERNIALLKLIHDQTQWAFSVTEAAHFFETLSLKINGITKVGVALTDLSLREKEQVLDYLSNKISANDLSMYLGSSNKKLVRVFSNNHSAIRSQYDNSINAHDKAHIADLIDKGEKNITFKSYGYLHVPDVYAAMHPLEQIDGVCILTGRSNTNDDEILAYIKAGYKLIIVPRNKESGSHWTLDAYRLETPNSFTKVKTPRTLTNGFCGDSAVKIAYNTIITQAEQLSLTVNPRIRELSNNMQNSDDGNGLRVAVIDALKEGVKLEEQESVLQADVSMNGKESVLLQKHQTEWIQAISCLRHDNNVDNHTTITSHDEDGSSKAMLVSQNPSAFFSAYQEALEEHRLINERPSTPGDNISLTKEAISAIRQQYLLYDRTQLSDPEIIQQLQQDILIERRTQSSSTTQKQIAQDYAKAIELAIQDLRGELTEDGFDTKPFSK